MRVLLVTSTFPRSDGDDQVPWLRELALQLLAGGVEIEILAPAYAGLASHTVDGLVVHRYRYWTHRGEVVTHESGAMNRLAARRALVVPAYTLVAAGMAAAARLARHRPYDVVHTHWPLPMQLLAQAAAGSARSRPRLVATFHGAEAVLARRKAHYRPLLRGLAARLDGVIANSRSTAALVGELTGREATVIPFGPPRGAVTAAAAQGAAATGASQPALPVVLAVGRLIERKGFPVLVRAAAQLRGKAVVHIVGGGDQEPVIRRAIDDCGVGDVVTLLPRCSNAALAGRYARCAVFCLPAIVDARGETETLGVVLIEAMAHGKPIVASALGGVLDVVGDGETGLLVPPGDPEALAGALLTLLDDPALAARLGEAGRRRAADVFSWDRIVGAHLAIYTGSSVGATAPGATAPGAAAASSSSRTR